MLLMLNVEMVAIHVNVETLSVRDVENGKNNLKVHITMMHEIDEDERTNGRRVDNAEILRPLRV